MVSEGQDWERRLRTPSKASTGVGRSRKGEKDFVGGQSPGPDPASRSPREASEEVGGSGNRANLGQGRPEMFGSSQQYLFQHYNMAPLGFAEHDKTWHHFINLPPHLPTGSSHQAIRIRSEFALGRSILFLWAAVQVDSWPAQPVLAVLPNLLWP